jgi:glycosyltransferase involved in cell wall biosynthesis
MSATIRVEHTFSLVIPAFNRADLIGETIESALAQDKPFSEIIVVDDGSTDDTLAVLKKYGGRITVIATENRGVQAARNTGIRAAKSDYVTLCDSDDLLEPDFLNVYAEWLAMHPSCDLLYTNFVSFNEEKVFGDRFSHAPPGIYDDVQDCDGVLVEIPDLAERIVRFQILFVTGMTIRRSMFDVIGAYNVMFNHVGAEDFEFTLRAVTRANIGFCKRPLARVRRHRGNDSVDQVRHIAGEIKIMEYALLNNPELDKYHPVFNAGLDERCAYVFDAAFAKGDFTLAAAMLEKFRKRPSGLRFHIKKSILKFPPPCRQAFWRVTQM